MCTRPYLIFLSPAILPPALVLAMAACLVLPAAHCQTTATRLGPRSRAIDVALRPLPTGEPLLLSILFAGQAAITVRRTPTATATVQGTLISHASPQRLADTQLAAVTLRSSRHTLTIDNMSAQALVPTACPPPSLNLIVALPDRAKVHLVAHAPELLIDRVVADVTVTSEAPTAVVTDMIGNLILSTTQVFDGLPHASPGTPATRYGSFIVSGLRGFLGASLTGQSLTLLRPHGAFQIKTTTGAVALLIDHAFDPAYQLRLPYIVGYGTVTTTSGPIDAFVLHASKASIRCTSVGNHVETYGPSRSDTNIELRSATGRIDVRDFRAPMQ